MVHRQGPRGRRGGSSGNEMVSRVKQHRDRLRRRNIPAQAWVGSSDALRGQTVRHCRQMGHRCGDSGCRCRCMGSKITRRGGMAARGRS